MIFLVFSTAIHSFCKPNLFGIFWSIEFLLKKVKELLVKELPKFAKLLRPATEDYLACPTTQQLPSWSRVLSCENKLQEDLAIAGSQDIKTTEKELIKNF